MLELPKHKTINHENSDPGLALGWFYIALGSFGLISGIIIMFRDLS